MSFLRRPNGPPIRQHDPDGRLIATGYQWDEVKHGLFFFTAATAVAAIYLSLDGYRIHGIATALAFATYALLNAMLSLWYWFRRRTVIFRRDGSVLTPYGRPKKLGARRLRIDHARIASIEVTKECDETGVAIYTVDGETFIVSHGLRTADARFVAVQLTKALRDLRESLATVESAQAAFHARRSAA